MRPIPKKLLIHSVIYAKEEKEDRWGNATLAEKQDINKVRLEPTGTIVRNSTGAEIQLAATLFYDCQNSRPKGITFTVDAVILFHDQKYRVQLVEPFYDGKRLHHYELGLIQHA